MPSREASGAAADLGERIGARIRSLRADRGYSLEVLGARSGVSRSAISLIERNASSPTAVVLERIATALDVPLASLFDDATAPPCPVARRRDQATWRDPLSGYLRRNLSPAQWPTALRLVEVTFPPGAVVSYETSVRNVPIDQQVWVLSGRIDVTVDATTHSLSGGDCLAMRLDAPVSFANPTSRPSRYVVAIVAGAVLHQAP